MEEALDLSLDRILNEKSVRRNLKPCNGVLLEKLVVSQLLIIFPSTYIILRLFTAFATALHIRILSHISPIHALHPISSTRYVILLVFDIKLSPPPPIGKFLSGFIIKSLPAFLFSPFATRATPFCFTSFDYPSKTVIIRYGVRNI